MLRFLLSACSIFALLITTAFFPRSAAANRCGFVPPKTLLALYQTSDAIYVGRYDKTEEGEVTEETPEYRVVPITKHYSISSALKGEPRKMLTLDESEYQYKNDEGEETEEEEVETADDVPVVELMPGDPVLLFVSKSEDEQALSLTDDVDGLKKMTPDRLAAYEARIRELNGIFGSEKPTYAQLVDWLIRCAEDPLTRWEGSYELLRSFQMMDFHEENTKLAKEKPENEATTADEEEATHGPTKFETGDPEFARAVTDAHKNALTRILLSRDISKATKNNENVTATNGDSELIDLVERWGDSSVAAKLVEQLRANSSDPNATSELMESIASMLKDDELQGIADEYSDIQWESAEAGVDGEDQEESEAESSQADVAAEDDNAAIVATEASDAAESSEAEQSDDVDVDDEDDAVATEAGEEQQPVKKTYTDLRNELLQEFLTRADKVIAKEKNAKSAKATR